MYKICMRYTLQNSPNRLLNDALSQQALIPKPLMHQAILQVIGTIKHLQASSIAAHPAITLGPPIPKDISTQVPVLHGVVVGV